MKIEFNTAVELFDFADSIVKHRINLSEQGWLDASKAAASEINALKDEILELKRKLKNKRKGELQ